MRISHFLNHIWAIPCAGLNSHVRLYCAWGFPLPRHCRRFPHGQNAGALREEKKRRVESRPKLAQFCGREGPISISRKSRKFSARGVPGGTGFAPCALRLESITWGRNFDACVLEMRTRTMGRAGLGGGAVWMYEGIFWRSLSGSASIRVGWICTDIRP